MTVHSVFSNDHVFILEMIDRNYLGQFGFYYYRSEDKKFVRHKENLFPTQYEKLSNDFIEWKADYEQNSGDFAIKIKDSQNQQGGTEREILFSVKSLGIEAKLTFSKTKDQEFGYTTFPILNDKRYWAQSYVQMNMAAIGNIKVLNQDFIIDTSDETSNWSTNFNDLSGIFPHKTFIQQFWMQHPRKMEKSNNIEPDRVSFYSLGGLQQSEFSRAETDWAFVDKEAESFEPILFWPDNHNDPKQIWRFYTHGQDAVSYSRLYTQCLPEHVWQRHWDVLAVREWEM